MNITADILSFIRKQGVKQMNSMEIWSYYFLPWVFCLFASLEYVGMEWMFKSFLSDTVILLFRYEPFPFFSNCPGAMCIFLFSLAYMNSSWSPLTKWSWWRLISQPFVVLRVQERFQRFLSSSLSLCSCIVVAIAMLYSADRSLSLLPSAFCVTNVINAISSSILQRLPMGFPR